MLGSKMLRKRSLRSSAGAGQVILPGGGHVISLPAHMMARLRRAGLLEFRYGTRDRYGKNLPHISPRLYIFLLQFDPRLRSSSRRGPGPQRMWNTGRSRSQILRELWRDPVFRSKMAEVRSHIQSPTSIERRMGKALEAHGIEAESQYPVAGFLLDFALLGQKIGIECDGDYWHGSPTAKERDRRRDKVLRGFGWTTLRFSESLINRDIRACVATIKGRLALGT